MSNLLKNIVSNDIFKKIIPFLLVAALLLIYIFIVLPILRGCGNNKNPVTTYQPVIRDSIIQLKIDSLKNANEYLKLQYELKQSESVVQEYKRKINNKILTNNYETIKNSNPDSAYLHAIDFIDNWAPDTTYP